MNTTMTERQYNLLAQFYKVVDQMAHEGEEFQEMIDESDILGLDLKDMAGQIERKIEIVEFIKRFEAGELKISASITFSNTMGAIIIEAENDYVFGYLPYQDNKEFFLSEVEYFFEEDEEDEEEVEAVPKFRIGSGEAYFNLGHAMKLGGR